jgi:hypothetical protein
VIVTDMSGNIPIRLPGRLRMRQRPLDYQLHVIARPPQAVRCIDRAGKPDGIGQTGGGLALAEAALLTTGLNEIAPHRTYGFPQSPLTTQVFAISTDPMEAVALSVCARRRRNHRRDLRAAAQRSRSTIWRMWNSRSASVGTSRRAVRLQIADGRSAAGDDVRVGHAQSLRKGLEGVSVLAGGVLLVEAGGEPLNGLAAAIFGAAHLPKAFSIPSDRSSL